MVNKIKINTDRLISHIESGIEAIHQGWESEECCIGHSDGGYQIHLKITRDGDDMIAPNEEHLCVSGI
jgi:hypothetical protein